MISDEQAALRVTKMSLAQRATWLRALEADRAKRVWPIDRPDRATVNTVGRPGVLPAGAAYIADQRALADLQRLFASDTWRALWRPGAEVHLYALGCTALESIASVTGPTAKLGTAEVGGLDRRVGELRRQRYGSVVRAASGWQNEPGWEDWKPFRKLQLEATPPACPVRGADQSLILTVPDGWSPGEAEALVNHALQPFRLHRFAVGDAGRALCGEHGIDPDSLVRYSRTARGYAAATELTLVRPQADAPRVAGLVAAAVARRLRAIAADPAAPAWRVLDRGIASVGPAVPTSRTPSSPARRRRRGSVAQ